MPYSVTNKLYHTQTFDDFEEHGQRFHLPAVMAAQAAAGRKLLELASTGSPGCGRQENKSNQHCQNYLTNYI